MIRKMLLAGVAFMLLGVTACSIAQPDSDAVAVSAERTPTALITESVSGAGIQNRETPVGQSMSDPTATLALPRLIEGVAPSVVRVMSSGSEGTGFVAFETGMVLTAFHVVGNAENVLRIIARDGSEHRATVLGADQWMDIALLSVPSLQAPPLPLALSSEAGDVVYAIGYAAGLHGEASVTQGIISARRVLGDSGLTVLQTDASINPGVSGGPLLDMRGDVIGVNVAKLRGYEAEYEGMGFAVSTMHIDSAFETMKAGEVRLLPTAVPIQYVATPSFTVPDSWQEYQYPHEAGGVSVWVPPSWEPVGLLAQLAAGPWALFLVGPKSGQYYDVTADLVFWAFDGPSFSWRPAHEVLDISVEWVLHYYATASPDGPVPTRITKTWEYEGPRGFVYVIEYMNAWSREEFDSVTAHYMRYPKDDRALVLKYQRSGGQSVTAAEHAILRQVFDSIRVWEP